MVAMDVDEERVALLGAMNHLMLQSIFVTAEHMRIYGQVLNDAIGDDEGQDLLDETKAVTDHGTDLVEELLDDLEGGEHDDLVAFLRDYLEDRRDFEAKIDEGEEEIMERGDESRMFY